MALGDRAIDAGLVIGTIAGEGGEWSWDLVKQGLDLRSIIEPDREATSLAQGCIVLRPIRHPVPLLRDAVTASSIGLERHGRDLCSEAKRASTLSRPGYQLAHPCNMCGRPL